MLWEPFSHTVIVNSNKIPNYMVNSFPSGETKACDHSKRPNTVNFEELKDSMICVKSHGI